MVFRADGSAVIEITDSPVGISPGENHVGVGFCDGAEIYGCALYYFVHGI